MTSIERVLKRSDGRLPGLAPLRLVLVVAIVGFQSVSVSESYASFIASPAWIAGIAPVLGLFALLGFTFARSAERHDPISYARRRLARTMPTLAVAVITAVLIVGPLATSEPPQRYFTDPLTWSYFVNLAGWPRFELPGVFEFNNLAFTVNQGLWMVPVYLSTALGPLAAIRFPRGPIVVPLVAAAGALAIVAIAGSAADRLLALAATSALAAQIGVLANALRAELPLDWRIVTASAGILAAFAVLGSPATNALVLAFMALPAAYLAIWAASLVWPGTRLAVALETVLPGFLLYSFPLQQLAIQFGPGRQSPAVNLALAVPLAAAGALVTSTLFQRVLLRWLPESIPMPVEASWRPTPARRSRPSLRAAAATASLWLGFVILVLLIFGLTLIALGRDPVGI